MNHRTQPVLPWAAIAAAVVVALSTISVSGQSAASRGNAGGRSIPVSPPAKLGQIDLSKSRVFAHVGKTGLGHVHAIEGRIQSGSIQLGLATNAGSIDFDMLSFDADTDRARKFVGLEGATAASTQQQVNKNMRGADVLDVRQFPTATFKIDSAIEEETRDGKTSYALKGKFTFHGKTRALAVKAVVSKQPGFQHLRGEFSILQSDFGITPYTAALGTIGVSDRLKIWGDLWIVDDLP